MSAYVWLITASRLEQTKEFRVFESEAACIAAALERCENGAIVSVGRLMQGDVEWLGSWSDGLGGPIWEPVERPKHPRSWPYASGARPIERGANVGGL